MRNLSSMMDVNKRMEASCSDASVGYGVGEHLDCGRLVLVGVTSILYEDIH